MSGPQDVNNIAELALRGVQGGDLSSASYKALGRVTPADYFDGE